MTASDAEVVTPARVTQLWLTNFRCFAELERRARAGAHRVVRGQRCRKDERARGDRVGRSRAIVSRGSRSRARAHRERRSDPAGRGRRRRTASTPRSRDPGGRPEPGAAQPEPAESHTGSRGPAARDRVLARRPRIDQGWAVATARLPRRSARWSRAPLRRRTRRLRTGAATPQRAAPRRHPRSRRPQHARRVRRATRAVGSGVGARPVAADRTARFPCSRRVTSSWPGSRAASPRATKRNGRPNRSRSTPSMSSSTRCERALVANRKREIDRGLTLVGPHRDELHLQLNELDARTHASQGEQRSFALALRLAGHHVTAELTGAAPVLLLDDVFSELDAARADALVRELPPGQTLLTTASVVPDGVEPERQLRIADGAVSVNDRGATTSRFRCTIRSSSSHPSCACRRPGRDARRAGAVARDRRPRARAAREDGLVPRRHADARGRRSGVGDARFATSNPASSTP